MKDTRRRLSREFKLEAVRQLASGRRQADAMAGDVEEVKAKAQRLAAEAA